MTLLTKKRAGILDSQSKFKNTNFKIIKNIRPGFEIDFSWFMVL